MLSFLDPWQRQRTFPVAFVSRLALRPTQPPIQWVPVVLSPGGKVQLGHEADHSPPSSHLVPRSRISKTYTSCPPCRLHGGSGTALLSLLHLIC
jgi:hypothetical protein